MEYGRASGFHIAWFNVEAQGLHTSCDCRGTLQIEPMGVVWKGGGSTLDFVHLGARLKPLTQHLGTHRWSVLWCITSVESLHATHVDDSVRAYGFGTAHDPHPVHSTTPLACTPHPADHRPPTTHPPS